MVSKNVSNSAKTFSEDKAPQEMGLFDVEYAGYTAIANTDSVRELMGNETLREFVIVVYEKITANRVVAK